MLADEYIPVISIGIIEGGWSAWMSRWRESLTRLTREVVDHRTGLSAAIKVNVVYQVPGSNLIPDFAGVRTGRFSKKDGALMIQVALPLEPPEDIDVFVRTLFQEAVAEAEVWAKRRGLAADLASLRELAARV